MKGSLEFDFALDERGDTDCTTCCLSDLSGGGGGGGELESEDKTAGGPDALLCAGKSLCKLFRTKGHLDLELRSERGTRVGRHFTGAAGGGGGGGGGTMEQEDTTSPSMNVIALQRHQE